MEGRTGLGLKSLLLLPLTINGGGLSRGGLFSEIGSYTSKMGLV